MRINFELDAKKTNHRKKGIKEVKSLAAKSYEYYMVLISSNMSQVKERYKKTRKIDYISTNFQDPNMYGNKEHIIIM